MTDPRAENCKGYKLDANGKVVGVNLVYVPMPSSKYELVMAKLIDEYEAGDTQVATCSVLTKEGVTTAEKIWLAWEWPMLTAGWLLPGNPSGQHIISEGYYASEGVLGPYAIYPGDVNHSPIGDVIGGIGLPDNRHVCFVLVWRERGAVIVPPVVPPATMDLALVLAAIDALNAQVVRLAQKQDRLYADFERLADWQHLIL